jgi:hypothetical protein
LEYRGGPDMLCLPSQKNKGEDYYEYLFVYTDYILAIGVDPTDTLMKLNTSFKLNLTPFIHLMFIMLQNSRKRFYPMENGYRDRVD